MNDFQQEIYKTIDILTEKKLKQLGFDRTVRGKVKLIEGLECVVEINGEDFTCKLRRGIFVERNDIVFVKFPQNSDTDKYVETILGGNETPENLVISAEDILEKLKMVDGENSGLDADTLDGKHASEFVLKTELYISTFIHNQIVPMSMWTITHNLNKYPTITVVDSSGSVALGEIQYIDENQITVTFTSEFSGKAYLN